MNYNEIVDEAMYKKKIFEDFPEDYHALKINIKINNDDILFEKIKNHILEHYYLKQ